MTVFFARLIRALFVKFKKNLKLVKMCLLEIDVFGCKRYRLLPKIKVPGDF